MAQSTHCRLRTRSPLLRAIVWGLAMLSIHAGLAALLVLGAPRGALGAGKRVELVVSVAASLSLVMNELKAEYEANNPGVTILLNAGSSGALANQIVLGAPVDLFISAHPNWAVQLAKQGLVEPQPMGIFARNNVVLIRPGESSVRPGHAAGQLGGAFTSWKDLASPQVKRVAIGNPDHVPIGQYAKAVLESLKLWEQVQPKLVFAADVRQVLRFVELGEVAAGIVYSSDAATSSQVTVVAAAPPGSHPPVEYPLVLLKRTAHQVEAERFARFLLSEQARVALAKYGFAFGE